MQAKVVVQNCQQYQECTEYFLWPPPPSLPPKRVLWKCWFLTTPYENAMHHLINIFNNLTGAVDPLTPPPSILCVFLWKWWQFWTIPYLEIQSKYLTIFEIFFISNQWIKNTVFDLISVLFAYVILDQKIALISEPPPFFLSFMYFVCVYPGCKTLLPKVVACEGPFIMMTGSLSLKKKNQLKKKNYKKKKKKRGCSLIRACSQN